MRVTSIAALPATAVSVLALLLGGGCEDSQARRRAEIQDLIAQATAELDTALASPVDPASDNVDSIRGTLQSVASEAGSVTDGSAGQQAAAALLAATANRELAQLAMLQASELESQARAQRALLHGRITAAQRLDTIVAAHAEVAHDEELSLLARERQQSRARLDEYRQRMDDLSEPIAQREMDNARDGAEAARLETEANARYREASELGHADGLPSYEEAVELEREADRYQLARARREIDLRYELAPEHELAQGNVDFYETLLTTIDATESSFAQYDDLSAEQVAQTRQLLGDLDTEVAEALGALRRTSAAMQELWEEADSRLQQAAQQAQRSATKSDRADAGAGRVAAARALEMRGRLHAGRARTLADQAQVLTRLAQTTSYLEAAGAADDDVARIEAARTEALGTARESFDQALSELGQAGGAADLAPFRRSLEKAAASLGGQPVMDVAGSGDAAAGGERARRPSTGGSSFRHDPSGADSPEALAEAMLAVNDLESAMAVIIDKTAPLDALPRGQREAALGLLSLGAGMATLDSTLQSQFGVGTGALPSLSTFGSASMFSDGDVVVEAQVVESGSRRSLQVTTRDGETDAMPLVQIAGRWFFDPAGLIDDPEFEGAPPAMIAVFSGLGDTLRAVAGDVSAGRFGTVEEVEAELGRRFAAFQEEMMQSLMGDMELPEEIGPPN